MALIVLDRFTKWLQGYPCKNNSSEETKNALVDFTGPYNLMKLLYSDNSEELMLAAKNLGIPHDKSRPYTPQTNAEAERAVGMVKQGTAAALQANDHGRKQKMRVFDSTQSSWKVVPHPSSNFTGK